MHSTSLTKAEKKYQDELRQFGCCVCRLVNGLPLEFDNVESVTAIHHIEGRKVENAEFLTIPLCARHHQYGTNEQPSIHANGSSGGKAAFKRVHGVDEYELLEWVHSELDWRPLEVDNG